MTTCIVQRKLCASMCEPQKPASLRCPCRARTELQDTHRDRAGTRSSSSLRTARPRPLRRRFGPLWRREQRPLDRCPPPVYDPTFSPNSKLCAGIDLPAGGTSLLERPVDNPILDRALLCELRTEALDEVFVRVGWGERYPADAPHPDELRMARSEPLVIGQIAIDDTYGFPSCLVGLSRSRRPIKDLHHRLRRRRVSPRCRT